MTVEHFIDIGGRHLYMEQHGQGSPAVVFESGGENGVELLRPLALLTAAFAHSIVYDRANVGRSDSAPMPRTSRDIVDDLHGLLQAAQVAPPYVLVGHSIAGLHLRVYAQRFPHDVAGLVLLDVSHPDQWQRELTLLPAELTTARRAITAEWDDPRTNSEGLDIAASAAQARAVADLGDLPLVVITAGQPTPDEHVPAAVTATLEQDWQRMQREIAALSRQSRQVIATESEHSIQDDQPELVRDEIERLVALVRADAGRIS